MSRDTHFDEFEDHTLVKHFILRTYLAAWSRILLEGIGPSGAKFPRAIYVDAFAGAGRDEQGQPGSPLHAAEIARDINARLYPGRTGPGCGMQVYAIESDHDRFVSLAETLGAYSDRPDSFVFVHEGELDAELLAAIRRQHANDPTFFFLDPFGVGGLDASLLPGMLASDHNELLVLFSDEGAVRLHGKAAAVPPDPTKHIRAAEAELSLFGPAEDVRRVEAARRKAARIAAGHKSNPRAKEIMLRAFGDASHVEIINATPIERRQAKMIELYSDLLRRSGARRVLPYAIETDSGRHKYTLLHASRATRAFAVMKDAMNRGHSKVDEGQLLFVPDTPLEPIVALLRARFAGRVVRWTGTVPCVRTTVIDETDLKFHECEALQLALDQFVIQKRPLTFQF